MDQPSVMCLYTNDSKPCCSLLPWDAPTQLRFAKGGINIRRTEIVLGILWFMILPLALASLMGCAGYGSHASSARALKIATSALPVGTMQSSYKATLLATGGIPPYSWTQMGGRLPTGLTLNRTTGTIAGTATTSGTFTLTTNVWDSRASSASASFTLKVASAPTSAKSIADAVAITAPSDGATVAGTVSVSASAGPQSSFASLQFYLGGTPLGPALTSSPYMVVWDTTQVADGNQNLSAIATSAADNATVQSVVAVTVKNSSWNPAVLSVPWASDFLAIAANEINVKTDPRLKVKAAGDGTTDDTAAVKAAIKLASTSGGGVVYFPTGDYKILAPSNSANGVPLVVPSRVILRGSASSTSRLFVNDPAIGETDWVGTWGGIDFQGASLSGMTDLGVYTVNSSNGPCILLWNRGATSASEIFFHNLDVHMGDCKSFWFESTNQLLVQGSRFTSNATQYSPIYFTGDSNIYFLNNSLHYNFGRVNMINDTNLLVQGNTFIRDAQNKDMQSGTAIESGGLELSFSQNVQVLNNNIETLNAPPEENADGEAITTQQSTTPNVLDVGTVTTITSNTLTDTNALWGSITASRITQYPEVIVILTGSATGQWRSIQGIKTDTKTLTLSQPWSPEPEVGSLYTVFVWTFMNATIQGNTLTNNPNGIVLWDGCYNCTVQNNVLTDSRGILLRTTDMAIDRSLYPEGRRVHEVVINSRILNNTVSNTLGLRPAYITLDTEAFSSDYYKGLGMLNVQVGGNTVNPYAPSPNQQFKAEIQQEGVFPCFLFGPAPIKSPVTTVFQSINYWNNSLSANVKYVPDFMPYTTNLCVTPSAPQ